MAQLVNGSIHRTTMSYARYLLSVHLGRRLGKDEHVDHINDDKTDDRVENFQILTPKENKEKYDKNNPAQLVEFICPICTSPFYLTKSKSHGKISPCCSKACGYKKISKTLTKEKKPIDVYEGVRNKYKNIEFIGFIKTLRDCGYSYRQISVLANIAATVVRSICLE